MHWSPSTSGVAAPPRSSSSASALISYDSPLWDDRSEGFAYVCRDYACQAPQDTVQGLAEALTGRKVEIREVTSDPGA